MLPQVLAVGGKDGTVFMNEDIVIDIIDEAAKINNLKFTDKKDLQWRKGSLSSSHIPFNNNYIDETMKTNKEDHTNFFVSILLPNYLRILHFVLIYMLGQNNANFKEITTEEIKKLFALHIIIGSMKLSRLLLYWYSTFQKYNDM